MGDYTRIQFYAKLRSDTPASVLEVLRATFTSEEAVPKELRPDHPFFRAPRWEPLFQCTSAYFETPGPRGLFEGETTILQFHSRLKNYDDEIEKFYGWIGPYLADPSGTVVGERQFIGDAILLIVGVGGRIIELSKDDKAANESV
jgi:hypothetical protein